MLPDREKQRVRFGSLCLLFVILLLRYKKGCEFPHSLSYLELSPKPVQRSLTRNYLRGFLMAA